MYFREVSSYAQNQRKAKNRATTSVDFDAPIKKLQKDKAMLEEGFPRPSRISKS